MLHRAATQNRVPVTRDMAFPAPVKGWVQSGNITSAPSDQAEVLDNFFPTAQGARLRGGSSAYADIGAAVVRLIVHSSGSDRLWAATASGLYNADRINGGGAVFADVAGLNSGDWSAAQISNASGQYTVAVNGTDHAQYYNGTAWQPITTAAVNNLSYDALVTAFAVGQTVTGGTSGASATIVGITQASATTGTLRLGAITAGPFQDNEALTSATGAATANGASAAGSAITITGIATASLSQVWLFKERLFFVEENSLSVWYLPVKSIGGAATEIDLGAVFRKGGSLMFGATWSLDSGSGLDDVCIFVSTNGEIAVYQGTDPASSSTWALTGVYDIAPPLNKHAYFKAGGDLAILTDDGIIPVSEALKKDRSALQAVAITYPIEDAWKAAVANATTAFPVTATLWQPQSLLMIGVPGADNVAYVANARTGAWCRYTGWDVRCGATANGLLYFATNAGLVLEGETGGNDNGSQYTGKYVPKFTTAGYPGLKIVNHAAATFSSNGTPTFKMVGLSDYSVPSISAPNAMTTDEGSVWGTGVWGTFVWGGASSPQVYTVWKGIRAAGHAVSHAFLVTSNQQPLPMLEILATRIRYEAAAAL